MREYTQEELMKRFAPDPDPEVEARQIKITRALLNMRPALRQELELEGRLAEARSILKRMLDRRGLEVSPDHEARIETCNDLRMIERWLDQAITATNAGEALE